MNMKKIGKTPVILLIAILMISTATLMVVVPPVSAVVMTSGIHFTSGFESGLPIPTGTSSVDGMIVGFAPNTVTWERVRGDSPYTLTNMTVTADAAHHGSYGLKVNITAETPPAKVDLHLRFGRSADPCTIMAKELWARMAIKFVNLPSNYGDNNYTYRKLDVLRQRGYEGAAETVAGIELINYNGTAKWVAKYVTYNGVAYTEIKIPINASYPVANTWHIVELHTKVSSDNVTADGRIDVYVDGTSIWSKTDIANLTNSAFPGAIPNLGHIRVGGSIDPYEPICWMMDCFEVISEGGPKLNNNVAIFTVTPATGTGYPAWTTFTFNGSGSCAPGGATYTWDYGDTTGGAGQVATHAYTATGSYNVTLTVTGSGTGTAGAKMTVNSRKLYVDPNLTKQHSPANTSFTVVIKVEDVIDLYTWVIGLQWDPTILYCDNVQYMYDWFPGADALLYGKDKGYVETPGAIDNVGGYATPYTMGRRGYTFPNGTTVPSTFKGINGSGPLFNATFSFVSIGVSAIGLTGPAPAGIPQLINSSVLSIYVGQINGTADLNPPPPGPPTASFSQNATFIYVGDWIHFDASASTPGSNGTHSIPIANYTWNFGDGTGDFVVNAPTTTIDHQFNVVSTPTFNVTLKVTTEDDPILGTWNNTAWASRLKVVSEIPVGCFIDLYTEYERFQENITDITEIGIGYDRPADTYRIDENVTLYAKVTYNQDPLEHRIVAFEVYDANGSLVLVRTDETNKSGIATISFRILTYCPDPEYAYGVWYIMAKTYVCDVKQNDTLRFHVQWIAELQTVTPLAYRSGSWVTTTEIHEYEWIGFEILVWNWALHDKPVVITVVVYDDDGVPIGNYWAGLELPATAFCQPEPDIILVTPAIYIPQWTYVGTGTVYVNCFYELPTECGVATCPEISEQFLIKM